MEGLTLLVPETLDVLSLLSASNAWRVSRSGGTIVVESNRERIYIAPNDHVRQEQEDGGGLLPFLEATKAQKCLSVDFSDIGLCRAVVLRIADFDGVFVDTDHGYVAPGPTFVEEIRRNPNWDWRRNPRK